MAGERATRSKRLRYALVAASLLAIVGVLAAIKACQISSLISAGEEMERAGPPPEAVSSAIARTTAWDTTIDAVGTVAGVESVEVSNDAPGIVERIRFESGEVVKRGRILVELDASTERAQLSAAKARRDLARLSSKRAQKLFEGGAIPRNEVDRTETELETAAGELASLAAQIDRKIVRAPFSGRLGIRVVNVGQYLAPGTTITTLEATDGVYVDFTVPQELLPRVRVGLPVRVELQGTDERIDARLAAIAPTIDAATRSVSLRANVAEGEQRLRPGMFVRASVVLPERAPVVVVPATAVVHASYGDSVFVIEPKPPDAPGMRTTPAGKPVKIVRQQFVRLGATRGDFVVIAEGIAPGDAVVTAGAFKLRNGAPVVVDNTVIAQPQLNPRPQNR